VQQQLTLGVLIFSRAVQEHCAERLCTRASGVPLHSVNVIVKLLNFALFNKIFGKFNVQRAGASICAVGPKGESTSLGRTPTAARKVR
jgi:hypothetical protein